MDENQVNGRKLNLLQRQYPRWIKPLVWVLLKLKVGPNGVTLFAIPLAVVSAYFIWHSYWGWAFWFVAFTGLCDLVDGPIAREMEKMSQSRSDRSKRFGGVIDPIVDRYSDCILLTGLFANVYFHCDFWWTLMVFIMMAFYFLSSWKRLHFESKQYEIIEHKMLTRTIFIFTFLGMCLGMWVVNRETALVSAAVLKVGIVVLLSATLLPLLRRSISGFKAVWNGNKKKS